MRALAVSLVVFAVGCGSADKPAEKQGGKQADKQTPPSPKAAAPANSEAVAKAFFAAATPEAANAVDWSAAGQAKALTDVAEGIEAGEDELEELEAGERPFAVRLPLTVIRKVDVASLAKDDRELFEAGWKPPGECTIRRAEAPMLPELPQDILAELPPGYKASYARTRAADHFVADCGEQELYVSVAEGKVVQFSHTIAMDFEANRFQGYAPPGG